MNQAELRAVVANHLGEDVHVAEEIAPFDRPELFFRYKTPHTMGRWAKGVLTGGEAVFEAVDPYGYSAIIGVRG